MNETVRGLTRNLGEDTSVIGGQDQELRAHYRHLIAINIKLDSEETWYWDAYLIYLIRIGNTEHENEVAEFRNSHSGDYEE